MRRCVVGRERFYLARCAQRIKPDPCRAGERPAESTCKYVSFLAQHTVLTDRSKKLPARFYVSPAGRKPVREWILELPEADKHTVGKDIHKVEFEWPLGRPHCAPLGHGLWEVRSDLDSNRMRV